MADETIRIVVDDESSGKGGKEEDLTGFTAEEALRTFYEAINLENTTAAGGPDDDGKEIPGGLEDELANLEEALGKTSGEAEKLEQSTKELLETQTQLVNQTEILEAESKKLASGRKRLNQGTDKFAENTAKAGKSAAQMARQTANLARAAGAIGSNSNQIVAAGATLIKGLGRVGAVAVAFAITIAAIILTIKALDKAAESIAKNIGGFSADVASATARKRIAEIEDKIKLGQEVGGDAANFIDATSEMNQAIRELKRDFMPVLLQIATVVTKILTVFIEFISWLKDIVIEGLQFFIDGLPAVFGIKDAVQRILDWLTKDPDPTEFEISKDMTEFFNPKNLGFPRVKSSKGKPGGGRQQNEIDLQDAFDTLLKPPPPPGI